MYSIRIWEYVLHAVQSCHSIVAWGGEMNLWLFLWFTALSCLRKSSSDDNSTVSTACQQLQVLNLSRNGIEFFMTDENKEEHHLQVLDLSHNRLCLNPGDDVFEADTAPVKTKSEHQLEGLSLSVINIEM
ncbi:hypothetical protein chiPu_0000571 [Chiloscyllium punctatum]|uniref:Uncharacterized protein n=1 Tax=Chiloscyllium punctatum TaxID=137246 RepID=A0A401RVN7_CHIPU|nr:hypothetical protein [Chiloscyllium punctatum]